MSTIVINGGNPISGEVTPIANKNSILKLIPACVLINEDVTITNVPKSSAVQVMLKIFKDLGGKVEYLAENKIVLNGSTIDSPVINYELSQKERASLMFLGPVLAKFGRAQVGSTGGCTLGNRPVDTLFQGLQDMGADITSEDPYTFEAEKLKANDNIWLMEASVTGTENLVLTAVTTPGKTVIYNAACEPHTQDMCNFLVKAGAEIEGIGTNKLIIHGVEKLNGTEWNVIPDHIDIGGLIVAAAITNGELLIKNAIPEHMSQILKMFAKMNLQVEIRGENIFVPSGQELVCKPNAKGNIDKIPDQPWPGFPVDLIPQALVLAAKAAGTIRIHSVMYEKQLFFVEELNQFQAKVMLADTLRAFTFGPSNFKGATINAPTIIQCAHAVVLIGLAAQGTTKINGADPLERRYPDLIPTMRSLGADISKID